ncbi:MAG: hypothetical protein KME26_01270 [Oscillatoria princeps RMCB-10]|nr:hypothetical protein [Oscillatoria princeps RMCB-10]
MYSGRIHSAENAENAENAGHAGNAGNAGGAKAQLRTFGLKPNYEPLG